MIHDASRIQRPQPRSVVVSFVIFLIEPPSSCLPFFFCCASSYSHAVIHSAPGGVFRRAGPYGFRRVFCIACCGTCCFSHPAALSAAGSKPIIWLSFFSWNTLVKARSTSGRLVLHSTISIFSRHTHIPTVLSDTCVVILSSSIWTFEVLRIRPWSILV